MIEEKPLNFKLNQKNSKLNDPQCRCGNCTQFYLSSSSVSSRGSSKTCNICTSKLIRVIDNDGIIHRLRTIVMLPALDPNPIFKICHTTIKKRYFK